MKNKDTKMVVTLNHEFPFLPPSRHKTQISLQRWLTSTLTDVVGVLLHDVRLQQVVSQDEGALLHRVQQRGGGPQLLTRAQLLPRRLGLRLQQVVDRRHHGLQSPKQRFNKPEAGGRKDTRHHMVMETDHEVTLVNRI